MDSLNWIWSIHLFDQVDKEELEEAAVEVNSLLF